MLQNVTDQEIKLFLQPDRQIRISFHVTNKAVFTINAVIAETDRSILHLESFGCSDSELSEVPSGTPVIILSTDTWAVCCFHGTLSQISGRKITVHLNEKRDIQQRRDFFRLDISMPVIYNSPEDQQLNSIEVIWKARCMQHDSSAQPRIMPFNNSFKVLGWDGGPDVEPRMVSLSGGGLKMTTSSMFKHGHLLDLTLFLPSSPIQVIFAVASVIRTSEVSIGIDNRETYNTAMKFVFISEKDQARIISHIFNDQPG